jgi:hypothetical protein
LIARARYSWAAAALRGLWRGQCGLVDLLSGLLFDDIQRFWSCISRFEQLDLEFGQISAVMQSYERFWWLLILEQTTGCGEQGADEWEQRERKKVPSCPHHDLSLEKGNDGRRSSS